jgi:hypothetical protein
VAVLALVAVAVLSVAAQRPASRVPLSPDNPHPDGARATAEILRRQGVEIRSSRSTAAALAASPDDATVLVTAPAVLGPRQWAQLADHPGDVVLVDVAYADLTAFTHKVAPTGAGADGTRPATCADPDARAAGSVDTGSGDVRARTPDVVVCFPAAGEPDVGAYATFVESGRRVTVIGNPRPLTNAGLAEAGNAALVLRVLGRTEHLTWLVPSPADAIDPAGPPGSVLPPGADAVAAWAVLVALAAMVWRGRRLGRVVVEPLPVVVKAAETTLGRARLYRRAGAHTHAAAALRAGAATRLARRVGVPPSAEPEQLLDALAAASGRPRAELDALLYGPSPTTHDALLGLVRALDILEAEVDQP